MNNPSIFVFGILQAVSINSFALNKFCRGPMISEANLDLESIQIPSVPLIGISSQRRKYSCTFMSMLVLTQVTLTSEIVKFHDNFDNMHDLCRSILFLECNGKLSTS